MASPRQVTGHGASLCRSVSNLAFSSALHQRSLATAPLRTMPPPPIRIGMRPLLRPQAILRVTRTPPTASRLGLLAGWTSFATHSRYRSLHLGPGSGSGSGVHNLRTSPHPRTTTNTTNIHLHRLLSLQLQTRAFHPSRRRHDVFFFAVPAVKSTLLNITRISLLFLPFVFRYK